MNQEEAIKEVLAKEDFSKARRLLEEFLKSPGLPPEPSKWARQKLALSTYKDKEIQSESALEQALLVLGGEDLKTSTDPETLGLAGAVHKRMWEIARDLRQLDESLRYYERARRAAANIDLEKWAWGSVNAAFVRDLLADEEPDNAPVHRAQAEALRREVCDKHDEIVAVDDLRTIWWLRASLVEAYFGRDRLTEARDLLCQSLEQFKPAEWQLESSARQLAGIARLRYPPEDLDKALEPLSPLVGATAARAMLIGKVGLALSGGGFRAALFHVGVLARLAELDVLRHVEALSCVSGGSILGALYYLELRRKLTETPDARMGRDAYIGLVRTIQDKLITALKRDIRTRAMIRSLPSLAGRRTILTGRMIDEALYADSGAPQRNMRHLTIQPNGEPQGFSPRRNNWRRSAKVPILVINATTLNTGHNWQFTASYMGEAPTCIEPAVDASERLRRLYYHEAPSPHGDIKLHTAVGASAAVPGIFRPIKLKGLYPNRVVRLCDGGVHDNQGIFGLVEQDCNILIVSDGCGQLTSQPKPSWFFTGVLNRTTSVLMDTVRRNSYRLLALQFRSKRVRELHFIHLKRGLRTRDVTWVRGRPGGGAAVPRDVERSGLNAQTQRALAGIRTDLDCFSENECHALMFAGYRMASRDLAQSKFFNAGPGTGPVQWEFSRVAALMDEATAATAPRAFIEELECGRNLFFRRTRLSWVGRTWKKVRGWIWSRPEPED